MTLYHRFNGHPSRFELQRNDDIDDVKVDVFKFNLNGSASQFTSKLPDDSPNKSQVNNSITSEQPEEMKCLPSDCCKVKKKQVSFSDQIQIKNISTSMEFVDDQLMIRIFDYLSFDEHLLLTQVCRRFHYLVKKLFDSKEVLSLGDQTESGSDVYFVDIRALMANCINHPTYRTITENCQALRKWMLVNRIITDEEYRTRRLIEHLFRLFRNVKSLVIEFTNNVPGMILNKELIRVVLLVVTKHQVKYQIESIKSRERLIDLFIGKKFTGLLSKMTSLKHLSFTFDRIITNEYRVFKLIKRLPRLQSFVVEERLTAKEMIDLSIMDKWSEYSLSSLTVVGDCFSKVNTTVKTLSLPANFFEDNDTVNLMSFNWISLTSLIITRPVKLSTVDKLKMLVNLRRLSFVVDIPPDKSPLTWIFQNISRLKNLQHLSLSSVDQINSPINETDIRKLCACPSLKTLKIGNLDMTIGAFYALLFDLIALETIEDVTFWDPEDYVYNVVKWPEDESPGQSMVKRVTFDSTPITKDVIEVLSMANSLEQVVFRFCEFADHNTVNKLLMLSRLKLLVLNGCEGFDGQMFKSNRELRVKIM